MARKVSFDQVKNKDGESDIRAVSEPVADPVPAEVDHDEVARQHLLEIGKFFENKSEDDLIKDHSMNPIHIHLINEMLDRHSKKKLYLSDGNREMLMLQHRKLKLDRKPATE
jgi:hypothetical protein